MLEIHQREIPMRCFFQTIAACVCFFVAVSYAVAAEKEDNGKYLYLKNVDTTLGGEKAETFCDPLNEIVFCLRDLTGKEWWRANDSFSMLFNAKGVTKTSPGKINMFPVKKPDSNDPNWYKITIDDGVLIQGNKEAGLTDAAEHFIELLEGTGDDLRLPKGVFTPKERKKDRPPFFSNDPEGGKRLDALWSSRSEKSEDEMLQAIRAGLLTCKTPKEEVLEWFYEKYIAPSRLSRKSLNLMIEASRLPNQDICFAAVKCGLSRPSWKTLRIQRAMLDAAMKADDNGKTVEQIALGFRYAERDYKDFLELLAPLEKSRDGTVRAKAIQVHTMLDKAYAKSIVKLK